MTLYDQALEAAQFIGFRIGSFRPRVAIVLGSGLGAVAEALEGPPAGAPHQPVPKPIYEPVHETIQQPLPQPISASSLREPVAIPYSQIPYFPPATAIGHTGRLLAGGLGGVPVILMQGRVHSYEGCGPAQLTFPIRVLGQLGVRTILLTNAAGGLNPHFQIGQWVLISDHINWLGFNPAAGLNDERLGARFFDMTDAYSKSLRALAQQVASKQGWALAEGVYLATTGPSFETPAEIRAFRQWGADLVGMSTVPETIIARHQQMNVMGLSCVTNLAAGFSPSPLNSDHVLTVAEQACPQLTRLLQQLLPRIAQLDTLASPCPAIES